MVWEPLLLPSSVGFNNLIMGGYKLRKSFCVRKNNTYEVGINDGIVMQILGGTSLNCFMELAGEVRFNVPTEGNYQTNCFTKTVHILMAIVHKKLWLTFIL